MKKSLKYISSCLLVVLSFSACSDKFLEEKRNYDNVNTDIYNYVEGCNGRLNDVYAWCLPVVGTPTDAIKCSFPLSMGAADICSMATEEYTGFKMGETPTFVNPEVTYTSMSSTNAVPDFFVGNFSDIQGSVYGRIRNINDFIEGVNGGTLTEEEKAPFLGQAYVLRAWCYYNLFKWYGGVPIVDKVQEPEAASYTPRSSAKAVYEFILEDINRAVGFLGNKVWSGDDWGRVTSGTALALKGRVMLLWASPLFNRANDESRWSAAYNAMKEDLSTINACGYGLYKTSNNVNGSDFAQMFTTINNPEAVFVTLYNDMTGDDLDTQKNNRWERDIRPSNTGGGGKGAGYRLVQLFPMADGKIPAGMNTYTKLATSSYSYDTDAPFMNRDPRFYRTFAFPGFRWTYDGDASLKDANNPSDGKNYVLWNYVWYTTLDDQGNPESGNSYGADNLLGSKQAIYVRKKSDDYDVNTPLYTYIATDVKGAAPFYSKAPLIELRYAEVLLNLAEAACGAGDINAALGYMNQVRQRAGVPDRTTADFIGDQQAACMSAILYERQIEFAYEGKRFDDLRRWMLFDGGTQLPEGAPSSWQLTGWGGNTCTWLGFTQMNGQRRERIEFRTADKYGVGKSTPGISSDPLLAGGGVRCDGVDLRKDDLQTQLETLKQWYADNLVTSEKRGDGYDSQHNLLYMNFRPQYYLLGLSYNAQTKNVELPQTIGWQDYNKGGANGTFDPLDDSNDATE